MKPWDTGSGAGDPGGKLSEMLIEGLRPAPHSTPAVPLYRERPAGALSAYVGAIWPQAPDRGAYSTVTDFARFRGWSTSVPICTAVW